MKLPLRFHQEFYEKISSYISNILHLIVQSYLNTVAPRAKFVIKGNLFQGNSFYLSDGLNGNHNRKLR
jgi:hypothetical protein